MGISRPSVYRLLSGEMRQIKRRYVERMAERTNLPPDVFFRQAVTDAGVLRHIREDWRGARDERDRRRVLQRAQGYLFNVFGMMTDVRIRTYMESGVSGRVEACGMFAVRAGREHHVRVEPDEDQSDLVVYHTPPGQQRPSSGVRLSKTVLDYIENLLSKRVNV